jgi:hypothetical protein
MALMSSFLPGGGYRVRDRLPDDYPVPGIMTPGREQASRHVASIFVDSETAEVRGVSTQG